MNLNVFSSGLLNLEILLNVPGKFLCNDESDLDIADSFLKVLSAEGLRVRSCPIVGILRNKSGSRPGSMGGTTSRSVSSRSEIWVRPPEDAGFALTSAAAMLK